MAKINIPDRLKERLILDNDWLANVSALQAKVQTIIKESPYFFPDYTDHGIDHINEVLTLADRLIAAETYSATALGNDYILDSRSLGFLICAILIHDLGMFLKTDGMEQLVYGRHSANQVEELDETDWNTSWSKYVAKTRRMKDNEKAHQFGRIVNISEDCVRKGSSTTEDDRRIIGEFLRQNHGRLAHEIAVHGFPGDQEIMLITGDGITDDDRDMIGLLARSHCINIRDTEEYLERFNEGSKPHGIPAFYLMTVLRMADYLDASEKRAPEILERIQKIRVPASEKEWCWNQCISKGPKQWELQKHNLMINASPTKSTEYVLLDNWLRSVQAELDLCWSILADQYSTEAYLLTIHRVCSNLQQKKPKEVFKNKFLIKEVKVTASPRIVELMMEPLYGDDPTYGVRELLQNAVDACVERKQWEAEHGNHNYKGLVDIRIEGNTFTITDNGMGMNEDILLNYYLCAGSSYRDSEAWKAAYAPGGTSRVARTGKFGVGFLAAFLLGDRVKVHTQHRDDQKGYVLEFDQRSMPLDVVREKRTNAYAPKMDRKADPTGTTITIELKDTVKRVFSSTDHTYPWYNWYAFDDPKVRYFIDGTELHHKNLRLSRDPDKNEEWLRLPSEDFDVFQWKLNTDHSEPEFYCNGIRIYNDFNKHFIRTDFDDYSPHVSVIDNDGKLDVDLARRILKSVPEGESLSRAVLLWHIARLLFTPWDKEEDYQENLILGFPLIHHKHRGRIPFLLSSDGFSLNYAPLLPALDAKDCMVLYYEGKDSRDALRRAQSFLEETPFSIVAADVYDKKAFSESMAKKYYYDNPVHFANNLLLGHDCGLFDWANIKYDVNECTDAMLLRSDVLNSVPERITDDFHLLPCANNLTICSYRSHDSKMPIRLDRFRTDQFPVAVHLNLNLKSEPSLFVQTLKDTLRPEPGYPQDLWIPYNMEERKRKFHTVFKELEAYQTQFHNEQKRKDRQKAEEAALEARRKAEEAAMEARRKAEEAAMEARFNTFKSNHAQVITQLLQLMPHSAPQSLPHILSETMSKIIAADFLGRPWNSLPEESLSELKAMCLAQFKLDDGELTAEDLHAEREEIEDFLFKQYEEMVSADNRGALTRLQSTLPPI